MKLHTIIQKFEEEIPLGFQEKWDHCGLNLGSLKQNITGILFAYDACLEVIDAAIQKKCQLVVTHHPFRMKADVNLNLDSYEGRLIQKCIQNNIALYCAHTNHDVSRHSLNFHYLKKLGLKNIRPLKSPDEALYKLAVILPEKHQSKMMTALFSAGAGALGNYTEGSFSCEGISTFKANQNATPHLGRKDTQTSVPEIKLEVIVSQHHLNQVLNVMRQNHPYEEPAYDLIRLERKRSDIGLGTCGEWEKPKSKKEVIQEIKRIFKAPAIRLICDRQKSFQKVGICTGSGSSLISYALRKKCDLFITGDMKYHQAVEAKRDGLAIADVGHFYSEKDSILILKRIFQEKLGNSIRLHAYTKLQDVFEYF